MTIRRGLLGVAVIIILAAGLIAIAQNKADHRATGKATTVTGCLSKGDEANEFYLTAATGNRYELRSDKVSLADQVGHKITVTGSPARHGDEDEDEDKERDERKEASEHNAGNLQVTNVQMVSTTCK